MRNFIDWTKVMLLITFPIASITWIMVKSHNAGRPSIRSSRQAIKDKRRIDELLGR